MSGVDDEEVWSQDKWFAALEAVPVPNGDDLVGVSGDVVFEKEVAPSARRVKRVKYVDVTGEDVVIVYK